MGVGYDHVTEILVSDWSLGNTILFTITLLACLQPAASGDGVW